MQRHSTTGNIFTILMHKMSIIRIHINIKRECYIIDKLNIKIKYQLIS